MIIAYKRPHVEGDEFKHYLNYPQELERIKERLPKKVNGYFNSNPVEHILELSPNQDRTFLCLDEYFDGNVREYLQGFDERTIKMYEKYKISSPPLAFIFPYHKLVLGTGNFLKEKIPSIEKIFRDLNYDFVEKRRKTSKGKELYSSSWNIENQLEFLRILRSKEFPNIKAADFRAQEIINLVHKEINADYYNFAEFIPKNWVGSGYFKNRELIVSPIKKSFRIQSNWKNNKLEELCKDLPLTRAIGFTSLVQMGERKRHIPMIDFSTPEVYYANKTLEEIKMNGILIGSGDSFHFYGFDLLDNNEWREYMESLKNYSWVDKNWPDLQLKQGFSMLRLTPSSRKFSQPVYLKHYHSKRTGTDDILNINKNEGRLLLAA